MTLVIPVNQTGKKITSREKGFLLTLAFFLVCLFTWSQVASLFEEVKKDNTKAGIAWTKKMNAYKQTRDRGIHCSKVSSIYHDDKGRAFVLCDGKQVELKPL